MVIKSKSWNWKIVPKDDKHWTSPASEVYYLCENWKEKKFTKFLDIGCGLGRNTLYFAKNGFNVSAFDLSQESVELTIENFNNRNLKYDNICQADMLEMPYKNSSFDCILAMNVISHTDTEGFEKILKEIYRILKPNGEAFLTLGSKQSYWFNRKDLPIVDENTKIRIEDGPENGIPHFYVSDDCAKFFKDFKIIEIYEKREITLTNEVFPHYYIWIKKERS